MDNNNIFRKKSMERVSSPEQLNDYIRVCNPSLWIVLVAVIILLTGAIVWSIFGHLDTTVDTVGVVEDGKLTVYVKDEDIQSVQGKKMTVNEVEYTITKEMCSAEPISVSGIPEYIMHKGNLVEGQWVYMIIIDTDMQNGIYDAHIVIESVAPMSFVIN